jgi:hypothetical protein
MKTKGRSCRNERRLEENKNQPRRNAEHEEEQKKTSCSSFFLRLILGGAMAIPFRSLFIRYGIKAELLVLSEKFITKS